MKPRIRALTLIDLLLTLTLLTSGVWGELHYGDYTNEFAVQIDGGEEVAQLVAADHGFDIIRRINQMDFYHLEHSGVSTRAKRSADDVVDRLRNDARVTAAHQQVLLRRDKRRIIHDKQIELPIRHVEDKTIYERHPPHPVSRNGIPGVTVNISINIQFSDPFYGDQWYLHNEGQTGGEVGFDVNVEAVWAGGFTGAGVVVTVLDDGCDHTHPDLVDNYDPNASTDLNDRKTDPMPDITRSENSHGTRCVGEIAAKANNSVCGVGIAFNAHFGCVRMLDGAVTDSLEADAMTFGMDFIDIKSASWGPSDNGKTMETSGPACTQAIAESAKKGRNGKGTIFVWATGNGGANGDMCGADGYVNNIHTLSIGCIADNGLSTYFTEVCASTMGVIFTGGSNQPPGTKEYRNPKVKIVTTDLNNDCTLEFQGTSSAAPLGAGCFALVLEANYNLTWRDMQHLVVNTARIPSNKEPGWTLNGAGFHVNPRFGFGSIDCGLMVELAQEWQTVGPQHICEVGADNEEIEVPPGDEVRQTLHSDGCKGDHDSVINRLEHVELMVEVRTEMRGSVSISLITPMGTHTELLSFRRNDKSSETIDFTFMTVHGWGEDPEGDWTLIVKTKPDMGNINHTLVKWHLKMYGTSEEESAADSDVMDSHGHMQKTPHPADKSELNTIMKDETESSETVEIDPKTREFLRMLDMLDSMRDGSKKDQYLTDTEVMLLARLLKGKGAVKEYKEEARSQGAEDFTDAQLDVLVDRIMGQQAPTQKEVKPDPEYRDMRKHHLLERKYMQETAARDFDRHEKKKTVSEGLTEKELDKMAADLDELLRLLKERK